MLTKFYVIYMLVDRVNIILVTLSVAGSLVVGVLIFIYLVCTMPPKSDGDKNLLEFSKKHIKRFSIPVIIVILLTIIFPTKKEAMVLGSFYLADTSIEKGMEKIDTYNFNNKNSSLNIDSILKIIDKTISKVDESIEKMNGKSKEKN